MDRILELINRLAAAADEDRPAIQSELDAALGAMAPDALAELGTSLRTRMDELAAGPRSADAVAEMRTVRDGIVAVSADQGRRDAEQAELDEEVQRLLDETAAPAEQPAPEQPAEPAAPEVPEVPAAPTAEQPAPEQPAESPAEQPAEPVAASFRPRRAPIASLARRQPPDTVPLPVVPAGRSLVADAGVQGIVGEGQPITDRDMLGRLFTARRRNMAATPGPADKVIVARAALDVPEARRLGDSPDTNAAAWREARAEVVERALAFLGLTPEAMVAAGGFCAVTSPIYDLQTVATRGRPTRDSLAMLQAPRGGVRFPTPLGIGDIPIGLTAGSAVWQWDAATDEAALDGDDVKPCWHVDCAAFIEELVEAVGWCIEFGNLGARAFPELVAQATDLVAATHDRVAEIKLLTAIKDTSTSATRARTLGLAKDLLAGVDTGAAGIRSRQRMDASDPEANAPLQGWFPAWIIEAIRVDVVRSAFPGIDSWDVTAERVMGWFRARSIVPTFYVDEPEGSGQIMPAQGEGTALEEFPTHAEWGLAPVGAHAFLDDGELDIGLVRDSALNAKNNYRIFSESFEGHAHLGVDSLWVRQELCADGSAAALVDTGDICGVTAS